MAPSEFQLVGSVIGRPISAPTPRAYHSTASLQTCPRVTGSFQTSLRTRVAIAASSTTQPDALFGSRASIISKSQPYNEAFASPRSLLRCGRSYYGLSPCAPADFLDDDAVVALAVAVADAGVQHVGVNLQERQGLPGLPRLVEHEVGVLQRLP